MLTRRSPLLLAGLLGGLLALLPACGHKGNPLPPRRRTPPAPGGFRLAQRGDAIELVSRTPTASVDGVAYDTLALEFMYGTGEVDLERAGTHLLVRSDAGDLVVKTFALPAPGTLLRAVVRAVAAGEKSPRSLTKALVVQAPLEAPHELVARVVEDGVTLTWRGPRPKEVPPPPLPTRPGFPGSPPESRTPGTLDTGTTTKPAPAEAATTGKPETTALPSTATTETKATASATASLAGEKTPQPSPTPAPAGAASAKGEETAATPATRRNGFFVYRRTGNPVYGGPLGTVPLELRNYKDTTAPLATRVCYVVRAVGSPDPLVESGPSNEACVVMRDITPPAAPAGIALLPRASGLELLWSPSGEQDLAGYRVFRAAAGEEPAKLAELDPASTSYLDESAQRGVRYSYTIVAFDQAGNQSAPSEAIEAALP